MKRTLIGSFMSRPKRAMNSGVTARSCSSMFTIWI